MKTLHKLLEDIEQRRQALKQRSSDAVSKFKEKSAQSSKSIAARRDELGAKAKQDAEAARQRKKDQDEQRAAARAEAEAKKQERENISAEIAASREERQDDNEQRMKDRDKKRMAKEMKLTLFNLFLKQSKGLPIKIPESLKTKCQMFHCVSQPVIKQFRYFMVFHNLHLLQ